MHNQLPQHLHALVGDVERVRAFVEAVLIERGITQCADFGAFAADVCGELVSTCPAVLGAVQHAVLVGDEAAALQAVRDGLAALEAVAGSGALYPASPYKVAYRGALRRFIADAESADGEWHSADVTRARREARKISDQLGVDLEICAAEGEELRQRDLESARVAEQQRLAKISSDRKKRQLESMRNLGLVDTYHFLRGPVKD